jgi:hypothetical protein
VPRRHVLRSAVPVLRQRADSAVVASWAATLGRGLAGPPVRRMCCLHSAELVAHSSVAEWRHNGCMSGGRSLSVQSVCPCASWRRWRRSRSSWRCEGSGAGRLPRVLGAPCGPQLHALHAGAAPGAAPPAAIPVFWSLHVVPCTSIGSAATRWCAERHLDLRASAKAHVRQSLILILILILIFILDLVLRQSRAQVQYSCLACTDTAVTAVVQGAYSPAAPPSAATEQLLAAAAAFHFTACGRYPGCSFHTVSA